MPSLHWPLPSLQHEALLLLGLQDTAEASSQALHYFPAVLWAQMVSGSFDMMYRC